MRTLREKFWEMMQDDGKHSFAKSLCLPFLLSAWAIGTVNGVEFLIAGKDTSDLIWTLSEVSILIYGAYKGGKVLIRRGENKQVQLGDDPPA